MSFSQIKTDKNYITELASSECEKELNNNYYNHTKDSSSVVAFKTGLTWTIDFALLDLWYEFCGTLPVTNGHWCETNEDTFDDYH